MVFIILTGFLSVLSSTNVIIFPLSLIIFWYVYHTNLFMAANSSLDFTSINDELSYFIVYITLFVLFIAYIYSIHLSSNFNVTLVYISLLLFCYIVFSTNNLFLLYFFYECSLLPILYIIIKWGSYPERSLSAVMLLIYTSIFTFPFIIVLFHFYFINNSFLLSSSVVYLVEPIGLLASLIVFFTFAVKLPIYGLHFWLPIAHVEAPTFGSMILAGILLNLGGVGLIRCSSLIDLAVLNECILSYLIVFIVYVTLVCCFQSDFNRLVAYSSVSHIMAIPLLYLANNLLSSNAILILILFHGLSSPILFILVGVLYSIYSTRQLIFIRGLLLTSPLLSFLIILGFFFTLSAPPFPSFVSEVYFLLSTLHITNFLIVIFLAFIFLSLVYNLNWLSAMLFSSASTSNMSFTFTYQSFMPLIIALLACLPFIFLTYHI